MDELSSILAMPPANIDCHFTELPTEFEAGINAILEKTNDFNGFVCEIYTCFKLNNEIRLLVICPRNSNLAISAVNKKPKAVWGAHAGILSAVYGDYNKYIVWHEALHLLGVKDCYGSDAGPNCGLRNCIMQYIPTRQSVGNWPFLCGKNIDLIKQRLKNIGKK